MNARTMRYGVCLLLLCLCSVPALATDLAEVMLENVPEWVELKGFKSPRVPLNIRLLAEKEEISLRASLEVQNHFYDLVTGWKNKDSLEESFQKALSRVKSSDNPYESVWNQEAIDKARFIIVFDLDDTLINQYYNVWKKGEDYWDIKLRDEDPEKTKKQAYTNNYIKLAPGWNAAVARVRELGGSVIFFTAKKDWLSFKIFDKWMFDKEKPLAEIIDGFMTKHHLVLVPGEGWERGRAYPMKDMELIDPTLKRIVLVDDNPSKTYQPRNVRVIQKYKPDFHLGEDSPAEIKAMYEQLLPTLLQEIEETLAYLDKHPEKSFIEAYAPYTHIGRTTLDALLHTGASRERALELIRTTDKLVPDNF